MTVMEEDGKYRSKVLKYSSTRTRKVTMPRGRGKTRQKKTQDKTLNNQHNQIHQ